MTEPSQAAHRRRTQCREQITVLRCDPGQQRVNAAVTESDVVLQRAISTFALNHSTIVVVQNWFAEFAARE